MRKAIVTLAVGERCFYPWQLYLRRGWEQWCLKNNYDLIVFDQPLDSSLRASNRSPAWQKLLAMASPKLKGYDQALWLDADILINPLAPDPLRGVEIGQIGMVRDCGSPMGYEPLWFRKQWSLILKYSLLQAHQSHWPCLESNSKELELFSYYDMWGFNSSKIVLYNTGVICFSPDHHRDLFLSIYERWNDGGPGSLHEMIPFNLELIKLNLVQEIQSAFNYLAGVHLAVWKTYSKEVQALNGFTIDPMDVDSLLDAMFDKSYFLHFAGAHTSMLNYLQKSKEKR